VKTFKQQFQTGTQCTNSHTIFSNSSNKEQEYGLFQQDCETVHKTDNSTVTFRNIFHSLWPPHLSDLTSRNHFLCNKNNSYTHTQEEFTKIIKHILSAISG
jgi:hypothetical protein